MASSQRYAICLNEFQTDDHWTIAEWCASEEEALEREVVEYPDRARLPRDSWGGAPLADEKKYLVSQSGDEHLGRPYRLEPLEN